MQKSFKMIKFAHINYISNSASPSLTSWSNCFIMVALVLRFCKAVGNIRFGVTTISGHVFFCVPQALHFTKHNREHI